MRCCQEKTAMRPLQWRHNGRDSVSNHQPHDCLLNRLFRRRSKKTSKLRVTGLCAGNSPGTGEFPAQMASDAENASIWWRHHASYPYSRSRYTGKTTSLDWNNPQHRQSLEAVSIRKTVLPGMAIPMLKIRRPNGLLIFNMEITIRR